MVNEVVQWAALAILFVLVSGAFRQIQFLSPTARHARGQRVNVGDRLSRKARSAVDAQVTPAERRLLLFVTENCIGCQKVLADAERGSFAELGMPLLIVARNPSAEFARSVSALGSAFIPDAGDLWTEFDVTNTPLVMTISPDGRVLSREVTHDVADAAV